MFKYISEILSQFSKTQRVMALLMVLTTITIITIGPSLIDSITTDRKELELKIIKQTERITLLENHTDTLDWKIRESQKSCTQEIWARENEFIQMLDEIRAEAFKYRVSKRNNVSAMMRVKVDTITKHGDYELDEPIIEPGVKVDISLILTKIDNMKKKIKH
jgi:hypothetical protein